MNTEKIRKLNDNFRKTFIGGRVMMTQGVRSLNIDDQMALINKVKTFNNFSKDNDPYQEHDFGCIEVSNQTFFWKIDYYDIDYQCISPDPSDDTVTNRILTIMLAEEF